MDEIHFPVQLKIRIDWSELDYFGHVNNVSFFKYIQSARVNYWDQIKLTHYHLQNNIGPMLASCSCDFKLPLHYPDEIFIYSRVVFIKNTSFSINHQIRNSAGELAAEATDVMVIFDFNENHKISFPEDIKKRIEALEGKSY
jgi:acyl-CoA thioester hydrolase